MATIDVDFEVFKQLTNRRDNETVTYNDVLRELLELDPVRQNAAKVNGGGGTGWVSKGVVFPNGTEFRAPYKGKTFTAKIEGNRFMMDGKTRNSPSDAACAITTTPVNGWTFWECRLPGETRWRKINSLRSRD